MSPKRSRRHFPEVWRLMALFHVHTPSIVEPPIIGNITVLMIAEMG
jgi:hypothetical protein